MRDDPARCQVMEGDPAPLSDLERRLAENGGGSLPDFIRRQAALTLERAERTCWARSTRCRGSSSTRSPTPADSPRGDRELSAKLNVPVAEVDRRARGALDEMVAAQSRRAIALWDQSGPLLLPRLPSRRRHDPARGTAGAEQGTFPGVPAQPPLVPRPAGAAAGAARERPSAQSRDGRSEHQLLADRTDRQAQRHRVHPPEDRAATRSTSGRCASTCAISSRNGSTSSGTSRAGARAPGSCGHRGSVC